MAYYANTFTLSGSASSTGNITLGTSNGSTWATAVPTITLTGGGTGASTWTGTNAIYTTGGTYTLNQNPGIKVHGDSEFFGNVSINGQDLTYTLAKIQERLAILVPDPKLLKKYRALQEAYDHYKTLEALCVEQNNPETEK